MRVFQSPAGATNSLLRTKFKLCPNEEKCDSCNAESTNPLEVLLVYMAHSCSVAPTSSLPHASSLRSLYFSTDLFTRGQHQTFRKYIDARRYGETSSVLLYLCIICFCPADYESLLVLCALFLARAELCLCHVSRVVVCQFQNVAAFAAVALVSFLTVVVVDDSRAHIYSVFSK